jgi:acetate kinase
VNAGARVLVVNAGSSSLKLSVVEPDGSAAAGADVHCPGTVPPQAVARFAEGAGRVDAVGHRVVHGGADLTSATVLDPATVGRIAALVPLAPLHQPRALAGIDAVAEALPGVVAVACFDTAFHAGLPVAAATYALPAPWRRRWGLRRFGFHGLSHAYAARRACELTGRDPASARVVSCHLGAGASLAAVSGGRSVDTTMGFTPSEGLVMATRSGDVDPGLLMWLQRQGVDAGELEHVIEHGSGLAGLAGHGGDMRAIRRAAEAGEADAVTARAVYTYRLRCKVAAMAAALGGLDVLVFTGGVGEHDAGVRADATADLAFLGVALDPGANEAAGADADITAPGAPVATAVVTAREDAEIAAQVRAVLGRPAA